ncbi:MAG: putative signal transducing protein [Gaiellaceae bacterium]
MDEASLTVVASGLDAEMLCGRLRLEGIRCYHRMTNIATGAWGEMAPLSGPIEVIVDAAKLERARELLDAGV